jgi:mxaJ protein
MSGTEMNIYQFGIVCWMSIALLLFPNDRVAEAEADSPDRVFTVAADPNNLPFSNSREEGFENKLAKILAHDLNAKLAYVWQPQRRGFFKDTLGAGRCDAVMGVPAGLSQCTTSRPYYRSTYVFVFPKARNQLFDSVDAPALRKMKIGVQLMGDGQISPPAHALIERGLADNLVGFSLYSDDREENPPAEIIRAVALKKIDAAIAWGPLAGYFARQQAVELAVKPILQPSDGTVPYAFDICVGIRKDDTKLRDQVDAILLKHRADIAKLLDEFAVPRTPEAHDKISKTGLSQ